MKEKLPNEEDNKAVAEKVKANREARQREEAKRGGREHELEESKDKKVEEVKKEPVKKLSMEIKTEPKEEEADPEDVEIAVPEKIDVKFALREINVEFFSYSAHFLQAGLHNLDAAVQMEMTPVPTINAKVTLESLGAMILSTLTKN